MFQRLFDSPLQLLILVLLIVVVVGWKRLPDVARSLGRSMRILKTEVEEMKKDGNTSPSAASSDTVKGETVKPTSEQAAHSTANEAADPPADKVSDPVERETRKQTPA